MKIIVRDRRQGKTTELINWLLRGKPQPQTYPSWSRVMVCTTNQEVIRVSREVRRAIMALPNPTAWLCERSAPHLGDRCADAHNHTITQICNGVWSLKDLSFNVMGSSKNFAYVVDDADFLLQAGNIPMGYPPYAITVTGERVADLCD